MADAAGRVRDSLKADDLELLQDVLAFFERLNDAIGRPVRRPSEGLLCREAA